MTTETIYALASGGGRAGVSVVRVSGGKAYDIALKLTRSQSLTPRYAHLKSLIHPKTNSLIDQALVIYFKAPYSFTGEDIVEFHIHGSIAVLKSLFSAFECFESMRMATPGEFSHRAFDHGKLDLIALEGLSDLIQAETELQKDQALRQLQGEISEHYLEWRKKIIHILAMDEAYIDFPEEDLPEDEREKRDQSVKDLREDIEEKLLDPRDIGEKIRNGFVIAIIGPPNVGKSTLLNQLVKREAAIVSDMPGTTRDTIEISLNLAGYPVIFIDTAGIRETENLIEIEGIKRSQKALESADLVLEISDYEHKLSVDKSAISIVNKIDLHKPSDQQPNICYISALTGEGIDNLLSKIIAHLQQKFHACQHHNFIIRERHRMGLNHTIAYLNAYLNESVLELKVENLRLAVRQIEQIVGMISVDDILDVIFKEFCLGK